MSSPLQAPSSVSCDFLSITRPPAQLLHSGIILSIDQVQVYQKTALEIQAKLFLIDNQIVRTHAVIEQLTSARKQLRESLIAYRALALPIRRLPTEILSEIFKAFPHDPDVKPFSI